MRVPTARSGKWAVTVVTGAAGAHLFVARVVTTEDAPAKPAG
ncbi:hypothetical protein [Kitasatospora kazusensis]